jgi:DNA-nicking Smr family endonuclease
MEKPRRSRLTEADHAAWASYASRTTPLPGRKPPLAAEMPAEADAPRPGVRNRAQLSRPRASANARGAHPAPAPLEVGAHPGGVDSGSWQRFRTGRLRAERVLDLHGQTAQRAYHALVGFVRSAHAERLRCVEIVTGRGRVREPAAGLDPTGIGVIRRELPHWLNLPEIRSLVLAAAHPHAANPGSVRLLLRRAQ